MVSRGEKREKGNCGRRVGCDLRNEGACWAMRRAVWGEEELAEGREREAILRVVVALY